MASAARQAGRAEPAPSGEAQSPQAPRGGEPGDQPPPDLNVLDPVIWPRAARREDGVLTIGGLDVRDLAAEFGTPLFACDEADFRGRCRDFRAAFGPDDVVCYAAKAFCCREVLRWAAAEGLGVAACSEGELETALSAGLPGHMVTLHGSSKTMSELARALEAGVGRVVLDSFEEIARLAYLAGQRGARPEVLVRVATGVEAPDDQRLGFPLVSGAAAEAVRRVLASPDLDLAGLHSHIGSRGSDLTRFQSAARLMTGLATAIRDEHGVAIGELNLGGGFGLAAAPGDAPAGPAAIASALAGTVGAACRTTGLRRPRLTVEPGRAIAGPGTVTLYEVGTVKEVPSGGAARTYVSVDGGMSDNIHRASYGARHTCVLASRASAAPPVLCRVTGRHCDSGDIVVRQAYLPADLAPGDLLAVACTGAYCRSAAGSYSHVPRPAVAAVRDGAARLLVRRETIADLLRLDAGGEGR